MEKVKNILSGHTSGTHAHDTTTTTEHSSGLAGQGSHFDNARDTTVNEHSGLTGDHHTNGTGIGGTQHTGALNGTNTAGPHDSNILNKADPTVDSDLSRSGATGHNNITTGTSGNHIGRDAAVAGGVGGAAYETEHHNNHVHKDHKEHKGILSFLHRDKNKTYTKEEEAEFERQEREHNSHAGRDAALGGAAVGVGAHEAGKHHGIESRTADPNAMPWQRDTVVSEPHRAHAAVPLSAKAPGQDLGDKLHGVDRNRGVTGSSGFPDSEGFGNAHHVGQDAGIAGTNGNLRTGETNNVAHDSTLNGHQASSGLNGNHHEQAGFTGNNGTSGLTEGGDNTRLQKDPSLTNPSAQGGEHLPGQETGEHKGATKSHAHPTGDARTDPHLHRVRD